MCCDCLCSLLPARFALLAFSPPYHATVRINSQAARSLRTRCACSRSRPIACAARGNRPFRERRAGRSPNPCSRRGGSGPVRTSLCHLLISSGRQKPHMLDVHSSSVVKLHGLMRPRSTASTARAACPNFHPHAFPIPSNFSLAGAKKSLRCIARP